MIVVIAWVGFVVYAHPGYLSYDSVELLVEARARRYSDLAPPSFAWLWHKIDWAIPGPFGMLVLQGTTFLAGTYGLCKRWLTPPAAAVVALVVLWFPPVLATLAVIWPESLAAGLLMLGASWMLSETRTAKISGLGVLVLAAAVREDGAAIAFPIVVLLFVWQSGQRVIVRYAIAAACGLAIALAAHGANAVLLDVQRAPAIERTHTDDLGEYLSHRASMFGRAMRWGVDESAAYVWFNDVQNQSVSAGKISHDASPSTIQRGLQPAMRWLGGTFVFAPWLYLALLLAVVPLVRRDRELLALATSGLMTAAVAFVHASTDELRGSLWLVVASVLVTIVALVRLANAPRR